MGVEERGVLPLVEGGCPVVMEELEAVMLDGSERLLLEAMVSFFLIASSASSSAVLLYVRMCARVCVRACVRVCACVVCGERVDLMFGQGFLYLLC